MPNKRARGTGSIILRGFTWWIRYQVDGRRVDESSESKKQADAVTLLNRRLTEVEEGRYQGPKAGKLTFEDLATMVTDHYDGRRSAFRVEDALIHLRRLFGRYKVKNLTADRLTWYVKTRRAEGAAPATVKYELAVLRKAFKLAHRAEKIQRIPSFPEIRVENTRTEFIDPAEFEKLVEALPKQLRGVVEFAYHTGWRVGSEVLPLQWHQVDFNAGVVRLEPGTTKSGEGRTFPFGVLPKLEAVLRRQRAYTDEIERSGRCVVRWVFHRNGRQIKDFRGAWRSACEIGKVLGSDGRHKVLHDFRRTAVRNLERASVPRSVAMKLVGHKTEAIYQRYAIVAEQDLAEGVEKLAQYAQQGSKTVIPFPKGTVSGTKAG